MIFRRLWGIFLLLTGIVRLGYAQLELVPLPATANRAAFSNARIQATDTVVNTLPFWDDFSASRELNPDLWKEYNTVVINRNIGLNPPTSQVVTLDGWTNTGTPYSNVSGQNGPGDSLVTQFIDLSQVPPDQRNTVYLSFFWQAGGLGEQPEADDSLVVEFRTNRNQWVQIASFQHRDLDPMENFEQELIPVTDGYIPGEDETFFHSYFQIRFRSYNLLNGPYDNWHLDYIFLDDNRGPADRSYFDRALTRPPTNLFDLYSAIPREQFFAAPEKFTSNPSSEFYNLSAEGLQSIEFTAIVNTRFQGNNEPLDTLNFRTSLDPLPDAFERRTLTANSFDFNRLNSYRDSLVIPLETVFYLNSGDTVRNSVDYRVNDTTRSRAVISNYYAYDDGEAEFGIGIRQSGGRVAIRYVLTQPDTITHLDIYFPRIGRSLNGTGLILNVWSSLSNSPAAELLSQETVIKEADGINRFSEYVLSKPIVVRDTFYVGYQQLTDDFMAIGWDKNNDTRGRIFFSVSGDGAWDDYDETAGSVMIRPRFENAVLTSIPEPFPSQPEEKVVIYPNPSTGMIWIQGKYDRLEIYTMTGNRLMYLEKTADGNPVDLRQLSSGLYIARIHYQGKQQIQKILLE